MLLHLRNRYSKSKLSSEKNMTDISKLDEATFQKEVIEAAEPVLVDFTAVWCAPCRMLDPVVEELANDWEDSVKVFKLDVDEHPNVAMNYQIMGVPTLMLFKNGEAVERVTGYQPKDRLEKKFNPHI
jgi:thioredoxin 1